MSSNYDFEHLINIRNGLYNKYSSLQTYYYSKKIQNIINQKPLP